MNTNDYDMSTNSSSVKPTYSCGICGKIYTNLEERSECEIACIKARKEAEEKRREAELMAKKKERMEEVNMAYENYRELVEDYIKDYGYYGISNKNRMLWML